jgi:hypothetical protein
MNRKFFLMIIVIAAIVAGSTGFAQQQRRPYNVVMKDIQTTFGILRKNIEANPAAAAEDAAKLEGYFAEVEAFWMPFNTQDAIGSARSGREAAAAIGAAAKANDVKKAQASVAAVQATCTNCHRNHREQTANGFLIKP